jgi:hypothetical protein
MPRFLNCGSSSLISLAGGEFSYDKVATGKNEPHLRLVRHGRRVAAIAAFSADLKRRPDDVPILQSRL